MQNLFKIIFLLCYVTPVLGKTNIVHLLQTQDVETLKLTVDQIIDPNANQEEVRASIASMSAEVIKAVGPGATSLEKFNALRKYLYTKGPWNNYKPFQYDFTHPYGIDLRNKTLAVYLKTKKGNWVRMPILFLILAKKIGLDVTLSTAPVHLFVQFTDDGSGVSYNVETTNGASFARAQWMIKQLKITPRAIDHGTYLQPLTEKETSATIVALLGEYLLQEGRFTESVEVFESILSVYPKSVYAMVKAGSAYYKMIEKIRSKKVRGSLTSVDKQRLKLYFQKNRAHFRKADFYGWIPLP